MNDGDPEVLLEQINDFERPPARADVLYIPSASG